MRRRYLRELYADRVARIKTLMPHAAIGADVIVGFPGETDEDFEETLAFSARPGYLLSACIYLFRKRKYPRDRHETGRSDFYP